MFPAQRINKYFLHGLSQQLQDVAHSTKPNIFPR
jgi:hypothetical protein